MTYHARFFYDEEEAWSYRRSMETDYPNSDALSNVAGFIRESGYYDFWNSEEPNKVFEFTSLEDFFKQFVEGTDYVYFDEEGRIHKEGGPALSEDGESYWYWHGNYGMESFPDKIVAKLGEQVI